MSFKEKLIGRNASRDMERAGIAWLKLTTSFLHPAKDLSRIEAFLFLVSLLN